MRILAIAAIAFTAYGASVEPSVDRLTVCPASGVSAPERWTTIGSPADLARFRIPPDMQPDYDPRLFCIHGCKIWSRRTLRVMVSYGYWGAASFDRSWGTACVEKRGALRVVLIPSKEGNKHTVIVWPVNDSSVRSDTDPLLNVEWSDPADEADAMKVIASVR